MNVSVNYNVQNIQIPACGSKKIPHNTSYIIHDLKQKRENYLTEVKNKKKVY